MAGWNVLEQNQLSDAELTGDGGGKVVESVMSAAPFPVRALLKHFNGKITQKMSWYGIGSFW